MRTPKPFHKPRTTRGANSWWRVSAPTLFLAAIAAGTGAFLARDLIREELIVEAPAEPLTSEAIENFMKAHSLLEYTTEKGDTLRSVAKKLRHLSEIERIRAHNPQIEKVEEGQALEPGTVLRIVYNGFELQDLLNAEEALDGDSTEEAIPQEGMNDDT